MALRSFAAAAVAAVVAASCMTATALAAPVPADSCTASGYLPAGHQEVPCVTVPRCDASNSAPSSVHIATFANGTAGPGESTPSSLVPCARGSGDAWCHVIPAGAVLRPSLAAGRR